MPAGGVSNWRRSRTRWLGPLGWSIPAEIGEPEAGRQASVVFPARVKCIVVPARPRALLAESLHISRSAFAKRFARVIGLTPLNYLLQWRLAVAKDLLAREAKTVSETALAVGYESASGFSTAFSRETGQAPKEFIGAHRRAA